MKAKVYLEHKIKSCEYSSLRDAKYLKTKQCDFFTFHFKTAQKRNKNFEVIYANKINKEKKTDSVFSPK